MGSRGALPECGICLEERRRLVELPCACDFRLCQPCVRRLRREPKCPQCRAVFREGDARALVFGAVECWECGRDERAEYAFLCQLCHSLLCNRCHHSKHGHHDTEEFQRSLGTVVGWVAGELESLGKDGLRRLATSFLPAEIVAQDAQMDLARRLREAANPGQSSRRIPELGDELPPLVTPQARLRSQAVRLLRFLGGEPAAEGPRDSLSAVLHDQGPAAPAKVLRDWLRREAAGGSHHKAVQTADPTDPPMRTTGEPIRLPTTFPDMLLPDRHGEAILALSGSADQAKVQWFFRGFHPDAPMETSLAPLGLSGKCRCVAVGSSVLVRDARRTWELKVIAPGWVEASVPKDNPIKPPTESAEVLKLLLLPNGKVLAAWEHALGERSRWYFTADGKHILPFIYILPPVRKMDLLGLQSSGVFVHVFQEWIFVDSTGTQSLDLSSMRRIKMDMRTKTSVSECANRLANGRADSEPFRLGSGVSTAVHRGKLVLAGGEAVSLEGRKVGRPSSRVVVCDLASDVWDASGPQLLYPQLHLPLLPWHGELVALGWTEGLSGGFVQLEALAVDPQGSDHRPIRDGWRAPDRLDTHTADFVVLNFDSQ